MRTAQPGDRVQVHYVKRLQDGSGASSRGRGPLEVTVGAWHPRLPGLGLALVGLAPGASTTVRVPPEQAYGAACAARVRRLARTRFPDDDPLPIGQRVRVLDRQGRSRSVRILEVRGDTVLIDTNHRGVGQALVLEVQLVSIHGTGVVSPPQPRPKGIAFDVDPDSLTSLRRAFPGWEIDAMDGVTSGALERGWVPPVADLLVVGAEGHAAGPLGLCRGLRRQAGCALTPLLVLLRPEEEALVPAVLDAGANGCLVLPIHGKDLEGAVARAQAGNRPGRHTLHLDRPQREDEWQDAGGEG